MKRVLVSTSFVLAIALIVGGVSLHGAQAAAVTGTIKGRIKLTGPVPANPPIRMGTDPLCAKLVRESGKRPTQELVVVGADQGLANTFVSLQGTFRNVPAAKTDPVVLTQRGCIYSPRVAGIRVGQQLRVVNGDTLLHNVHGVSTRNNGFNVTQPQSGKVDNFVMKSDETMLHLKCDVHSWMTAYVGVLSHPYFAVSGGDGSFTIANVPAGRQTIRTWHERYGTLTQVVTVKPGETVTVDIAYKGTERPSTKAVDVTIPSGLVALNVTAR